MPLNKSNESTVQQKQITFISQLLLAFLPVDSSNGSEIKRFLLIVKQLLQVQRETVILTSDSITFSFDHYREKQANKMTFLCCGV